MSVRYRWVNYQYTVSQHAGWQGLPLQSIAPARWRPPADLVESRKAIELTVELAGVAEDALSITLFQNALVVEGWRERPRHAEDAVFHAAEIRYGPFRLEVAIAGPVDTDGVMANYEAGMLHVRLPRPAEGGSLQ